MAEANLFFCSVFVKLPRHDRQMTLDVAVGGF